MPKPNQNYKIKISIQEIEVTGDKLFVREEFKKAKEEFRKLFMPSNLKATVNTDDVDVRQETKHISLEKSRLTNRKNLSSKLDELINGTFFSQPRTTREIREKLNNLGYVAPTSSLPSYLLPKVRSGELNREKKPTKYGKIYTYEKPK